jgi:hypothetical protein
MTKKKELIEKTASADRQQAAMRPHLFQPGQSGNPAGRKPGSRNKLSEDFVGELYEDFLIHGESAIIAAREKDPATYLRIIASLLPKEVEMKRPLEGLSEEQLYEAIGVLQAMMASVTIEGEVINVSLGIADSARAGS